MANVFKKSLLALVFTFSFLMCGCTSLNYSGDDYSSANVQEIKTNEEFLFKTYKKTDNNINLKVGISKTQIPEILAIYVQVENLAYETPYIFKVEDLEVYNPDGIVQFISSNNYLNIYQTQEASIMASGSTIGANLANMTNMMSNYTTDFNQTAMQNKSSQISEDTFSRIDTIGQQILKHSIKYSSTISPRKSQYYYFFIEDLDKYPLKIKYKDLIYQFNS